MIKPSQSWSLWYMSVGGLEEIRKYDIHELIKETGLDRRAIRFYIERDLVPPAHGSGRGSYYSETHLEIIKNIRELQDLGLSLKEIKDQSLEEIEAREIYDEIKETTAQIAPYNVPDEHDQSLMEEINRDKQSRMLITDRVDLLRTPDDEMKNTRDRDQFCVRLVVMPGIEVIIDYSRYELSPNELKKYRNILKKVFIKITGD